MDVRNKKDEIYVGLLLLMLLGVLVIKPEIFLVVSMIYYASMIFKRRGKVCIPRIPGLGLYMLFVVYGTIIGVIMCQFTNVLKDLYYILSTLIWVFIGYNWGTKKGNDGKELLPTLCLFGGIVSLVCIIRFVSELSFDFDSMRTIFVSGVYEVGFILPIMLVEVLVFRRIVFSKFLDILFLIAMSIQVVLSFGRIAWLEPILVLCVMLLGIARNEKGYNKIAVRIILVFGCILVLGVCVFYMIPDSITDVFVEKIVKTSTEVDATQTIDSVKDAMNSWRAYEMQAVQKQWKESGLFAQFLGTGIGTGIHIDFVPYTWTEMVVNNEIPLLHNGFLTLLPKGGIVAVVALSWLFVGNIIKGYKFFKDTEYAKWGRILVAISIAGIATTYVARGPVQQGAFLAWGLMLGWYNAKLNSVRQN